MLQKRKRIGTAHDKAAHVRDIEQSRLFTGIEVFLNDAGFILHRHIPTAKFHHFGTEADMLFIEYGFKQLFHCFNPYFVFDSHYMDPCSTFNRTP
jgi:hypothetical protein